MTKTKTEETEESRVEVGWPTVGALAVIVAGVVAALAFTPDSLATKILDKLPWETIAGLAASSIASGLLLFLGPLFAKKRVVGPRDAVRRSRPTVPPSA